MAHSSGRQINSFIMKVVIFPFSYRLEEVSQSSSFPTSYYYYYYYSRDGVASVTSSALIGVYLRGLHVIFPWVRLKLDIQLVMRDCLGTGGGGGGGTHLLIGAIAMMALDQNELRGAKSLLVSIFGEWCDVQQLDGWLTVTFRRGGGYCDETER